MAVKILNKKYLQTFGFKSLVSRLGLETSMSRLGLEDFGRDSSSGKHIECICVYNLLTFIYLFRFFMSLYSFMC